MHKKRARRIGGSRGVRGEKADLPEDLQADVERPSADVEVREDNPPLRGVPGGAGGRVPREGLRRRERGGGGGGGGGEALGGGGGRGGIGGGVHGRGGLSGLLASASGLRGGGVGTCGGGAGRG